MATPHTIADALRLLRAADTVTELRSLNTPRGTVSGYFNDVDDYMRFLQALESGRFPSLISLVEQELVRLGYPPDFRE